MNFKIAGDPFTIDNPPYKNIQKGYLIELKYFKAIRYKNIRLTL